jgi:hypothetical protein
MAGEAMNVRGPCSSCGAQLASDQRYCVECGHRVGPPLALPYALPAAGAEPPNARGGRVLRLPLPPEMAGLFAALALGFGVVLGTAISPNLAGIIAAPSAPVVVEAPSETPSTPPSGGGGGGSPAPAIAAPATAVASTTPSAGAGGGGGGGGGGHKKSRKKKQQAAPITFSGTVIRINPVAQSYALSTPAGGLIAIHADTLPQVGDQFESPVRKLNNGTYAEAGSRNPTGTADQASFQGTVTYCADLEDPARTCDGASDPSTDHWVYAVSSLGASVLVTVPQAAAVPPPKVGSNVQVSAHIDGDFQPVTPSSWATDTTCSPAYDEEHGLPNPSVVAKELTQTSVSVTGQATSATIESVVQTKCTAGTPAKLILSADDVREAGRDLAQLDLPSGIDPSKLAPGQAVQTAVDVADTGGLTLKGITSDQGAAAADDASQGQGSLTGT